MRQEIRGSGQQRSDSTLLCEPLKIPVSQTIEMIVRSGFKVRQSRQVLRSKLADVCACSEPCFPRCLKDSCSLIEVECTALAEDVDEIGQPLPRRLRNHLIADHINVGVSS